ncbi:hypothetical protein [Lunatimonas salinarum]|nr:hypothetical protein [Lunatimonas salinarum]
MDKLKSAYDTTCGSGSLLLLVAKEADVIPYATKPRQGLNYRSIHP